MASPLLYSCVAYNTTILAECTTSAASTASSIVSLTLPMITHAAPEKLTYSHGANLIHYIAEAPSAHAAGSSAGGLAFLVVTDNVVSRRIPFAFLVAVRDQFFADFSAASTPFDDLPNYGCAAFNADLRRLMQDHTRLAADDPFTKARHDVGEATTLMGHNIEAVLQRGDQLTNLVDRTGRLETSAGDFRKRSRGLKRQMWWKNVKLMALLVVVVTLIVVTMVLALKS